MFAQTKLKVNDKKSVPTSPCISQQELLVNWTKKENTHILSNLDKIKIQFNNSKSHGPNNKTEQNNHTDSDETSNQVYLSNDFIKKFYPALVGINIS